jgi:hypothetical protein
MPLQLPPHHGFFDPDNASSQTLFGFPTKFRLQRPYTYLELSHVPADQLDITLNAVRNALRWAAVRLDMGILINAVPLQHAVAGTFDGQFATAIPSGIDPMPMRVDMSHKGEEPTTRLIAALEEGASKTGLATAAGKKSLATAAEFFAAADFEITANSQFLMLSTVFEVLADPKPRPTICIYLVEELIANITLASATANSERDAETSEALRGLRDSIVHWKNESISSSIRKLATRVSRLLGDANPEETGKRACDLYSRRNGLVHRGESVAWTDVQEFRKLAREAIAVEAGCHEHIRDRYP